MKNIYSLEIVNYDKLTGEIDHEEDLSYHETLKDAEESMKHEEKYLTDGYGVALNKIVSSQDYNNIDEFLKEFENYGNDEEHFFIECIELINNKNIDFVHFKRELISDLKNKEMTVYELDNFIKDKYNNEIEKTSSWFFLSDGEINTYLNNGFYNYCGLFEVDDLFIYFEVIEHKEDEEKSIIKVTDIR